MSEPLALTVSPAFVDAIAGRVVELLEDRGAIGGAATSSPYLTTEEAADYLRASRQRVFDLVHGGRLSPARDGRRLLLRRDDLDDYLAGGGA